MTANVCECGGRIEWAWTDKGARIAIDPGTVSGGNLQPFDTFGGKLIVRVVAPYQGTRLAHQCPHTKPTRRRRR